jgi:5-deoxy-5-amino-3-dehydroquinate synthase
MRHDKKAVSGLTFVLDGPSGIEIVSGVSEAHLSEAFDAMQLNEK